MLTGLLLDGEGGHAYMVMKYPNIEAGSLKTLWGAVVHTKALIGVKTTPEVL